MSIAKKKYRIRIKKGRAPKTGVIIYWCCPKCKNANLCNRVDWDMTCRVCETTFKPYTREEGKRIAKYKPRNWDTLLDILLGWIPTYLNNKQGVR